MDVTDMMLLATEPGIVLTEKDEIRINEQANYLVNGCEESEHERKTGRRALNEGFIRE